MTIGRLLILDDDAMIAETVSSMAARLNFEALITLNPTDFFERLKDFDPTHVIIDLSMPEMDGLEVMRRIDARCAARIIIVSGSGNRILEAARRVGVAHGLDILGILEKPFRRSDLKSLLLMPSSASAKKKTHETARPQARPNFTREELAEGLARDEFTIHLQPKVRCRDNRIIGFETLARWNHPTLGLIMPSDFVALFEEFDLEMVWMEKLIRLAASYAAKQLPADINLALNMSMSEHSRTTTPLLLSSVGQESGVTPNRLVIEVVENGLIGATAEDIEMFARLRLEGFQLAIDDFGLGYSSLSRLVRIPFSELKIDRSFVQEVRVSREARRVVRSLVAIGHSLEMSVTAEGVEDLETLDIVKSLGCDSVQGFVYSRPVPIEGALRLLDAGGVLTPAP